jgi:hypothetical protein
MKRRSTLLVVLLILTYTGYAQLSNNTGKLPFNNIYSVVVGISEYDEHSGIRPLQFAHRDTPRRDAIMYFEKLLEQVPYPEMQADICNRIANVYTWAGSPSFAYHWYVKAAEEDSSNASYKLQLINIGIAVHRYDTVLLALKDLYRKKQSNSAAW